MIGKLRVLLITSGVLRGGEGRWGHLYIINHMEVMPLSVFSPLVPFITGSGILKIHLSFSAGKQL